MKKSIVSGILTLLASANCFSFEEAGNVTVAQNGQRDLTIKENAFIYKCSGAKSFPSFQDPLLKIVKDENSSQFLLTYEFKTSSKVFLLEPSGQVIPLKPGKADVYTLTVLRPQVKSKLTLDLQLDDGEEKVLYRIESDAFGKTASLSPIFTDQQKAQVCMKDQIWIGVGGSFFQYSQKVSALDADASFTSIEPGSYHIEGRWYQGSKLGIVASFKNAPGKMDPGELSGSQGSKFNWQISELGLQYREQNWLTHYKGLVIYPYLRSSLQHHLMPRLSITGSGETSFSHLNFGVATVGVGANIFTQDFYFLETYINAKVPVWENGAKIQMKGPMFDGALGFGKSLGSGYSVGAYIYGHYDQIGYQSRHGSDQDPGRLQFLFTNFDLRLGYAF